MSYVNILPVFPKSQLTDECLSVPFFGLLLISYLYLFVLVNIYELNFFYL